jgi:hypothetical protein
MDAIDAIPPLWLAAGCLVVALLVGLFAFRTAVGIVGTLLKLAFFGLVTLAILLFIF